jgi:hypothetical protein
MKDNVINMRKQLQAKSNKKLAIALWAKVVFEATGALCNKLVKMNMEQLAEYKDEIKFLRDHLVQNPERPTDLEVRIDAQAIKLFLIADNCINEFMNELSQRGNV